ncbi:hypothetical protein M885DRAFT_457016 [Pelagophyceae sp. CCMP2097]|nr:hypothetical protein M885DRAFT_457016 [Pelagophyceae sp. CCMP2097]
MVSPFDSAVSAALGWAYFLAWSASFYPNVLLNHRRRSVVGLSFEYTCLNLLGFTAYSVYTLSLRYSPGIRRGYADAFGDEGSLVTVQDCVFTVHAAVLTLVMVLQILVFDRGTQTLARWAAAAITAAVGVTAAFAAAVLVRLPLGEVRGVQVASWLAFVYWLSVVKLAVTLSKYLPQAQLNFARKSTVGWSIGNVLLDFAGGALSVAQLVFDGSTKGWAGLIGNPIKFALGLTSMAFDVLFMVQHYVLFTDRTDVYEAVPQADSAQTDAIRLSLTDTSMYI